MLINVRAAEEVDRAFIVEMAREASIIEDRPLPAADSEEVRGVLPQDLDAALVAVSAGGDRVGAAWWHEHDPPLAHSGEHPLPELIVAVRAQDRGNGIGKSLIEALARRASVRFSAIVLNVHIRNPAARLYSRTGFTVLGKGRGPLGVCLSRDLPSRDEEQ